MMETGNDGKTRKNMNVYKNLIMGSGNSLSPWMLPLQNKPRVALKSRRDVVSESLQRRGAVLDGLEQLRLILSVKSFTYKTY